MASPEPPPAAGAAVPPSRGEAEPEALSRKERKEVEVEAIRQGLEPLAPGERPYWVTVAALVAGTLGLVNLLLYGLGVKPDDASTAAAVGPSWLLIITGAGMWFAKYWAVLVFELLLGITVTFGALSLLVASSLKGAAISIAVAVLAGTLFWKLVRPMARMQTPPRPVAPDPDR